VARQLCAGLSHAQNSIVLMERSGVKKLYA
jgi:hypothetical protein